MAKLPRFQLIFNDKEPFELMSTFKKLREHERVKRKNLIIEAAMELFSTKSFHKIGMRDIANSAGISAAAIYRYFPSRDDILVEALIRHIGVVEAQLEERIKNGNVSFEQLVLESVDYLIDNESVFQMMGHFMITGQVNPGALKKYNKAQRYFLDMLENINERTGLNQGNRLLTHAIYASIMGVVMTFRKYPGRTKKEIKSHIRRLSRKVSSVFATGSLPDDMYEKSE